MKLTRFKVNNYRSVNDSGDIEVGQKTALVGRNESGKSNLLLALQSLNPSDGEVEALSFAKDFPRDRERSEYSDDLEVVSTVWRLTAEERAELGQIFPRAANVQHVRVSRRYKETRYIGFIDLPNLAVAHEIVDEHLRKLQQSLNASLRRKSPEVSAAVKPHLETLVATLSQKLVPAAWAAKATPALDAFKKAVSGFDMPETCTVALAAIDHHARQLGDDEKHSAAARSWVINNVPIFIYVSDYSEVNGHQSISSYIQNKTKGLLTDADKNFEKLCKVAGLDPVELNNLLHQNHEERQLHTNRAGAVVTRTLRRLWTDRELKVRFNLDADHFDTLISDPSSFYDVEVNLNERSRGFKWFFSFYTIFAADTKGGSAENAILLLDEPGLYLHAVAQKNLLNHFNDFDNQVIFTTHSPFMIPVDDISTVRTVNIDMDKGTTVSNNPMGDTKTLFPLQTALGYEITQTLFVAPYNLVTEGVTDYWYVTVISDYLTEQGRTSLPENLVVTPVGGAQKVPYMVSLLTSQKLGVLVLLDDEREARQTAADMIKAGLTKQDNVVFVSDALPEATKGADIEDLIEPAVFDRLVRESYVKELAGRAIPLNDQIPRIVARYTEAFKQIGLEFNKTRPAKLFLRKAVEQSDTYLTDGTLNNFEALFTQISGRYQKSLRRRADPFE